MIWTFYPTWIRVAMSHQPLLINAIRLASAVALLVSVMTSPIRPAPKAGGGSQHECLRRNFGVPGKAAPSHRPHVPATSRVVQVKAVSSQSKPSWMAPSVRQDADLAYPPAPSAGSAQHSTALGIERAIHPLRC
jgi:hypothetical protein